MGAYYELYNFTRREKLGGTLHSIKASDFASNPGDAALVLWYMFAHRGDQLAFVSDYDQLEGQEFFGQRVSVELLNTFKDKTEESIQRAVDAGWIEDCGKKYVDPDDPSLFTRDLRPHFRGRLNHRF